MSKGAYRTIVILLTLSLASFLVVQALWIRNSVNIAQEEIKNSALKAMNQVGKKLELRQNLSHLKNKVIVMGDDSLPGGVPEFRIVAISDSGLEKKQNSIFIKNEVRELKKPKKPFKLKDKKVYVTDSLAELTNTGQKLTIRRSFSTDGVPAPGNLDSLVQKMLMEIRDFNFTPLEKIPFDSLRNIINQELIQNGVNSPFAFAVKKGATGKYIAQSPGFDTTKTKQDYFSVSLYKNNIIKAPDELYLYFTSSGSLIFQKLKGLLISSIVFGVIILLAFAWTLRLIARQKRMTEIKNDFINNMTHELKTPIATINVATDALKNPKVRGDEQKMDYYTAVVKEENNKMHRNVEKVLQLALTDKENFKPEFSEVNLNLLVQKCLSNFQLLFTEKNIVCEFTEGENMPLIKADAFHLENAINNLIDNAVKYSRGNPVITIASSYENNKVELSVEDNGIGMDETLKLKVFDKFYRGQSGNIHDVKGFGIGLSYVYNIVKAHGGEIEVESVKGKGSTFTISLPV